MKFETNDITMWFQNPASVQLPNSLRLFSYSVKYMYNVSIKSFESEPVNDLKLVLFCKEDTT